MAEIDTSWIATALAASDSRIQAEFLNSFFSALVGVCKRSEGQQLWHIAAALDSGACRLMKELIETRVYHEDQYQKDQLRRDALWKEIAELEERKRRLTESEF